MSGDYRHARYERLAEAVARDLRALADRVERESKPRDEAGVTGTPRHTECAEAVQHAIVWGIANIGAHRLIDAAYHADVADGEATR